MKKITSFLVLGLIVSSGMAQTLKFRFTFNDKLTDESTSAYVLTPSALGSTSYVDGKYGKAVQLNGMTDYFDLLTEGILNPSLSAFTMCAWVYNTQAQSDWVFNGQGFDEEQIIHQLNGVTVPDSRGRIFLHHIVNSSNSTIQTVVSNTVQKANDNAFAVNTWQHVALVSDPVAKTHKFYVNGLPVGEVTTTAAFESCTGGFRFGAHKAGNGSFWHGKLDEICMFEGNLTQSQLQKVMNNDYNITGLRSVNQLIKVKLYPNPATDVVYVETPSVIKSLTVLSLDGRKISETFGENKLNISSIAAGNYLLKITSTEGLSSYNKLSISK